MTRRLDPAIADEETLPESVAHAQGLLTEW